LAYQPPASSTFLLQQTSHHQPTNSTFLSEQIITSHQPPAKRTGWVDPPLPLRLPVTSGTTKKLWNKLLTFAYNFQKKIRNKHIEKCLKHNFEKNVFEQNQIRKVLTKNKEKNSRLF
jgi:hypothetical protein